MALNHTMILGQFRTGAGNTNLIKVTQGAQATVAMRQQVQHSHTPGQVYPHQMFVFNGNIYFPFGHLASNSFGWAKFNHELTEFETFNYNNVTSRFIPLFDRVGHAKVTEQGWGFSPEDKQAQSGADSSFYPNDYAVVGSNVIIITTLGTKRVYFWPYPFSAAPAAGTTFTVNVWRIAELAGDVYGVEVNSAGGTLDLYKVVGGALTLVGTPTGHSDLTSFDGTNQAYYSLFKFNNKLFFIAHANVAGKQKLRLFEMDTATGGSTERNSYLPSEWGNVASPSASTTGCVFEVYDNIGSSQQVFIVRCERTSGAWECYEFVEGSFTVVLTGQGDRLYPLSGVIWDPSAKAAQFKSAADTVPSSVVETEIDVFDLQGQGTVNVDPRYRLNNAESPPYSVCTGKVPNDDKTALASVPSRITTLANLSDDFEAGSIDDDLWGRYAQSIQTWATGRDVGAGDTGLIDAHRVQQIGGAIRFGQDPELTAQKNGMGVKGRWSIDGAFQIDLTLKDPENINDQAGVSFGNSTVGILCLVRLSPNEGFGFLVWRSSSGPQVKVRGIYMALDGTFTYSADFDAADGDVVRIVRDGSNVWSIIHDPAGLGNILTPGGGSNYAQAIYMVLAGVAGASTWQWVEPGTADGSEPGFSDLTVSGAGSLGLYDGGRTHLFDWDHVTDEPPPTSGTAELFVDTEA